MSKRVLVTGGTGFVGANLTRRLLADGHDVHLLVRANYANWRIADVAEAVRLHQVDLEDAGEVATAVGAVHPDWIFHLAAYGAYSWQSDPRRMVQTNVVGAMNLVEAGLATGFESLINVGSSSEYGFKDHPPAETEVLEPNSHYALTKATATMYCGFIARSKSANIATVRLYSVFGPYEDPGRFLPTLIAHGRRGKLPPLADPNVARDFVYVDDVCSALVLVAAHQHQPPGAIYNVGTGIQTNLREVVEVARRVLSVTAEPAWGSYPARTWDTPVWVADNRALRATLGWQPHETFESGFRRFVEWYRQNRVSYPDNGGR